MPARLTLHLPDRPTRVELLAEGREYILGRDAGCEIELADERVSRRHALVDGGEQGWRLRDLGSKNGTALDGQPVGETLLPADCWLSLGGLLVHFRALSTAEDAAEAVARLGRWRTSLQRQRELQPGVGLPELLRRVLASVAELSGCERGFVLLARGDGDFELAAASGLAIEDLRQAEFSGSVGAVERVLAKGAAVAASDALADTGLAARPSVLGGGIRALVCVPLRVLERTIGVLYADSRRPGATITELDVEILDALAGHAALAIAVARLDLELRGLADRLAPGAVGTSPAWSSVARARQEAEPR